MLKSLGSACYALYLTMFTLGYRSLDFLHYVFKLFPVRIP